MLHNERDYTISLFSLYWTRSTGEDPVDTTINAVTLSRIVDDVPPGLRLSTVIRIMQGAGSVNFFISAMASHFDFYTGVKAFIEVSFLSSLWNICALGNHQIYSELLAENRNSAPLWSSIFSLLRRITSYRGRPVPESEASDAEFISLICPLTTYMSKTIGHCQNKCSEKDSIDLVDR
jgi:hypothetical protein